MMEVTAYRGQGNLQCVIDIGAHNLVSDVPRLVGGEDAGPEPHDILAAALAACTALTVTMVARRKNIDLQDVRIRIEHGQQGDAYVLTRHIRYIGNLDAAQRTALTAIANKCPVHRTLSGTIQIVTEEE